MVLRRVNDQNIISDKLKDKVKKLHTLSKRGIPNEKEAARKRLDNIIKKYKVNIRDLGLELEEYHELKYYHLWEKQLIIQITGKILNNKKIKCKKKKEKYYSLFVYCTKSQFIQIEGTYKTFKELYKKEIKSFFQSFINRYGLHSN